ncbi:MAG: hypothetical protein AAGC55_32135, partial [Myxococcota bacterium]
GHDGDRDDTESATRATPLPDDRFGRLFKLAGHFSDYREIEPRFSRWHRGLTATMISLTAVAMLPAAAGYLPVPMWVGATILFGSFIQLGPLRRRPDKSDTTDKPAKSDRPGPQDGAQPSSDSAAPQLARRSRKPAFAERAEIAAHLLAAPGTATPVAAADTGSAGRSASPVRNARLLGDITQALEVDRLYGHQRVALDAFAGGASVVLATPPGSGRKLLCDALVLYTLLAEAERVLYLCRDAARVGAAQQRFDVRAEATHWKWNIAAVNLAAGAGASDPSKSQPALIFAHPEAVHRQLCGASARWRTFLSGLGAVVLPDVHEYSGAAAGHLAQLIRRLGRATGRPQAVRFAATADPGHGNLSSYAARIIGRPMTVIGADRDDAPRPRL